MLKIAIIEDEEKTAETLTGLIKTALPESSILGIADTVSSGIELLAQNKPDIIFLDVEIRDGLSFEILKQLPEINFQIIFTTAHCHYAVKAFEYSALDYIVKPLTQEAIERVLHKAEKSIQTTNLQSKIELLLNNLSHPINQQKIILQTAESNFYVRFDEILRCEAENNYCYVILGDNEKIMLSKPLKSFEMQLPSNIFFRVHQSHLINVHKIRQVKKRACKIIMSNGEKIPLSARRKDQLLDMLKSIQ